jgi:hypothetical protein
LPPIEGALRSGVNANPVSNYKSPKTGFSITLSVLGIKLGKGRFYAHDEVENLLCGGE